MPSALFAMLDCNWQYELAGRLMMHLTFVKGESS
jgi:hypothetical protein